MKEKLKWFIREMMNMYSTKESYFSKKRFESSIAFLSGVGLILGHAYKTWSTITTSEILSSATLLFIIAGYTVSKIEASKVAGTDIQKTEDSSPEEPKTL